ncbi:MAG: hypothetical protein CRN43_10890 [Candidatus Nephrothrix sp. EaCA]|nr:MAG: hypothetical protein CRN43_10890 [Candidatus Nephrothrix sp. EaCA]
MKVIRFCSCGRFGDALETGEEARGRWGDAGRDGETRGDEGETKGMSETRRTETRAKQGQTGGLKSGA